MDRQFAFKTPVVLRTSPIAQAVRALIVLVGVAASGLAWAQSQPQFSQQPPINSSAQGVMPNVILAIDNSSSMGTPSDPKSSISALIGALNNTFGGSTNPFLGHFRFAYESMFQNSGFGPNRYDIKNNLNYDNSMKIFDTAYQSSFLEWVNKVLYAPGSTPSQNMFAYAGEYLKGRWLADANNSNNSPYGTTNKFIGIPSEDNPWNEDLGDFGKQGTPDDNPLTCRRAYFIFMSDGDWNSPQLTVETVSGSGNSNDINYDAYAHTLPDGATYDPAQGYGKIYVNPIDSYFAPPNSTLADFAFYYWATNLMGTSAGAFNVIPQMPDTGPMTYTYGTYSNTYNPYWDPQNDPATWPHMQTYTIGFAGASNILGFDGVDSSGNIVKYQDQNFFQSYASGSKTWPQTGSSSPEDPFVLDLVHASYNGRGRFYPATDEKSLTYAFQNILATATTQSSSGGTASASASGSHLNSGTVQYVASYNYDTSKAGAYDSTNGWGPSGTINGWSGAVQGYAGDDPTTLKWSAAIQTGRAAHVFTADKNGKGIQFAWDGTNNALSGDAGDTLVSSAGLTGPDVNAVLSNPLGDIVNSQLFFVGNSPHLSGTRTNMVYVGANDGMLHGFDAGDGTTGNYGSGNELMAYVPRGLFPALHANTFANDGYAHHYWVDGSPFAGDVQIDSSHWATVLVGTLGAGGPGYFVLNVSSPSAFSASNVMLDATDTSATSALTGQTITNGPKAGQPVLNYIGNQFNQPVMALFSSNQSAQIMRINTSSANPDWAVIMGNGYNSASGVPVLLIQSLTEPGMPLYTVSAACTTPSADACIAAGNGLGAPRAVDVDGNGTADIVYAGDLMGNLWKFDISDPDPTKWTVAYGGKPMFTAMGQTPGMPQPITSAPVAVPNPYGHGGFLVAFGTGKNLTDDDTADSNLNSVYGLYDAQVTGVQAVTGSSQSSRITLTEPPPNTFCSGSSGGAVRYSCLYQQGDGAISAGTTQTAADANGNSVTVTSNTSSNTVTDTTAMGQPPSVGSGATMLGWYYDIPEVANGNAAKVLANPSMMDGNTLVFYSQNVASSSGTNVSGSGSATESCDPTTASGPITTVNFFNALTGNYPDSTITIGDQTYDAGQGNRFQLGGVTTFLQNGTNSLNIVGAGKVPWSGSITHTSNTPIPSKVIGWRVLR